ncbi:MAG TPA: DNA polymerase I [Terriglobales bacterium]|nr:DNA polymerase I [Terriglobales bacterium]
MPPKKTKSKLEAATQVAESESKPVSQKAVLPAGEAGKGRVFLIDSFSFIFRAYHAMARQRPMSTRTGIPTSATYVFVNMLRKLIADFHPEYIAAVFDTPEATFRDQQAAAVASVRKWDIKTQKFEEVAYGGYKANRAEMPADLSQQVPYVRRALEAFHIPIIEMPGFEADDVIGTLAWKAAEAGHPVYVVSSDKDMLQLVNERVCVLNPPKDNLICDRAKVEEILGVPPERVVDVMALRGDTIDNIPGAPGIGDKGSVEIIKQFGTVEAALDRAEEVTKKTYRESLLNNRDTVMFSKTMATIECSVPVELDLKTMVARDPDTNAARELFTELEFTSLVKEFLPALQVAETRYTEAQSAKDVERVLQAAGKSGALAVALDIVPAASIADESDSEDDSAEVEAMPQNGQLSFMTDAMSGEQLAGTMLAQNDRREGGGLPSPAGPTSLSISATPGTATTVLLNSPAGSRLSSVLSDPSTPKAIHDWKAAIHALRASAIELAGVQDDPMLYSYLLDPTYSSHRLDEIALRRFNLKIGVAAPASGTATVSRKPPVISSTEAADMTGRFASALRNEVQDAGLMSVYRDIDLPLVPVLARMEEAGVKIDCDALAEMSRRLESQCEAKATEIFELVGERFNISSPKQLGKILFERLNLPRPVKYGKGKTVSTAVDVLENLAAHHEVPRMVLDYRQLSKLKSTYVDALPSLLNQCTQRLHTTFDQTNTATGRLSSKNPNLQNIPIKTELGREIRAAFIAEPGNLLISADYSQIELRLLAHFSEDPLLLEAFERGDDIHRQTASKVFNLPPESVTPLLRGRAKAINFGIPYGLSPFGLSQQLGIEPGEAKAYIDGYFEKYAGVREYLEGVKEQARRDQKVATLFGRVRPIPDINSRNANQRGFAERTAVNTPLQGSAADLIKLAMIALDREIRERGLKSRMTLQVHDELVFEVPESEVDTMRALVKDRMENVHKFRVPLLVEIGVGNNWRDAK